ncbi:MAG: hypothetical protein JRN68_07715 [Nitrososphaerota archaeon]|nr:hypothetical protein [Nitrososphaerota archaeon]
MFDPILIEEPFLEFKNGITYRGPRRGILNAGPYDFSAVPESKICLLYEFSLAATLEKFWSLVDNGDPSMKYRGYTNTFGSNLRVVKKEAWDRTSKIDTWFTSMIQDLEKRTMVLLCLPDDVLKNNYLALKTICRMSGHRIQFLRESTLGRAAIGYIALAVATAIYAKVDGNPWRLRDPLPPSALYLGIAFARPMDNTKIYYGIVDIFDRYGKLVEAHARAYPLDNAQSGGLFIPHDSLLEILQTLKSLNPLFIIVHKSSSVHSQEKHAFEEIRIPNAILHLETNNPYRLYDISGERMSVFRGLLVKDTDNPRRAMLYTTGNVNDTFVEMHRLGTPRTIEINIESNNLQMTIEQFAEQILKLTKLDWNSLHTEIRLPITLKYANRAAQMTSANPAVKFYDIRDLM